MAILLSIKWQILQNPACNLMLSQAASFCNGLELESAVRVSSQEDNT